MLSEVVDAVLDVKQAHRRVPETHALRAVLDQLFTAALAEQQDDNARAALAEVEQGILAHRRALSAL